MCTYKTKQNTIRQRRRRKLLKKRKELHSDCSLYESWPRETYVRTYICTIEWCKPQQHCRSNSKKQLGDITIDTPFPPILYIYTVFVSHCAPPVSPPHWPLFAVEPKSNQPTKQTKETLIKCLSRWRANLFFSLYFSLFLLHLSVRLLLTLSATRPAPPRHVLRPVLLLCCAPPPPVCPSRRVEIPRLGCPALDFYYKLPLLQKH